MSQPILVGHLPDDRSALDFARELARRTGARLVELHDASAPAVTAAIDEQRPALVETIRTKPTANIRIAPNVSQPDRSSYSCAEVILLRFDHP